MSGTPVWILGVSGHRRYPQWLYTKRGWLVDDHTRRCTDQHQCDVGPATVIVLTVNCCFTPTVRPSVSCGHVYVVTRDMTAPYISRCLLPRATCDRLTRSSNFASQMVCHTGRPSSLPGSTPYRHFFSEKYHTGVSQGHYWPEIVSDYFRTCAIALSWEARFNLRMQQKPFVGTRAWPEPAGGTHSNTADSIAGFRGGDPRTCKGHKEKGREGWERG